MAVVRHLESFSFFHITKKLFTLSLPHFCVFVENFTIIAKSASNLWPKMMLSSNMPSVRHLEFENVIFGDIISIVARVWFSVPTFNICELFSLRYVHITFYISGRPPHWIRDDVIILYPMCVTGDRQTDKQRDKQTEILSSSFKAALFPLHGAEVNKHVTAIMRR